MTAKFPDWPDKRQGNVIAFPGVNLNDVFKAKKVVNLKFGDQICNIVEYSDMGWVIAGVKRNENGVGTNMNYLSPFTDTTHAIKFLRMIANALEKGMKDG